MVNIYQTLGKVLFNHKWFLANFTRQWARSYSWQHSQYLLVLPSIQGEWHYLFWIPVGKEVTSFRHFYLKLVSWVATVWDTSFRQKCLKLRCHDFSVLADWSTKQCHAPCTLGKTSMFSWLRSYSLLSKTGMVQWFFMVKYNFAKYLINIYHAFNIILPKPCEIFAKS